MQPGRWAKLFFGILILGVLVLRPVSRIYAQPIQKADFGGSLKWEFDPFLGNQPPAPVYIDNAGSIDINYYIHWDDFLGHEEASYAAKLMLIPGSKPKIYITGSVKRAFKLATAYGWIDYYIRADKKDPYAPDVTVPLKVSSKGYCTVPGNYSYETGYSCGAAVNAYFGTPTNPAQDQIISGNAYQNHYGSVHHWEDSRTILENVPLGKIFAIRMVASGGVSGQSYGEFYAYIDPTVQIDPDWMVDYNGRQVPGTQLYSVTFSPGFNAVTLPGVLMLLLD
jgi:hypothetical protein